MTNKQKDHAHVIVLGNEKGGTGKSTTAMHIVTSLLQREFKVAVIDLDSRQQSLSRYIENRQVYASSNGLRLDIPKSHVVHRANGKTVAEIERREHTEFHSVLSKLDKTCDFILIDCPGSDTYLSRLAHGRADTLVTPLNDSFVDLDLIGHVDPRSYQVKQLSLYSEAVWEGRKQRALSGRRSLDWVVMRNRTSTTDAKNKRRVNAALEQLQNQIAFRYIPGLSERVIYRELFPKGLTLIDMKGANGQKMTMSHVSARQEIRRLMDDLSLPGWGSEKPQVETRKAS